MPAPGPDRPGAGVYPGRMRPTAFSPAAGSPVLVLLETDADGAPAPRLADPAVPHLSVTDQGVTRGDGIFETIGVISGYLGAAPAIVWASGIVFAFAFIVLVPVAIWIYTLVFAFSSLWFAHYCLAALEQMRGQEPAAPGRPRAPTLADSPVEVLPDERTDRATAHRLPR